MQLERAAASPALHAGRSHRGAGVVSDANPGGPHDHAHVFASDAGVIDVGGTGRQAALLVVTGGNGSHAGATGFLQLRGSVEGGQVTGDYVGEICTP